MRGPCGKLMGGVVAGVAAGLSCGSAFGQAAVSDPVQVGAWLAEPVPAESAGALLAEMAEAEASAGARRVGGPLALIPTPGTAALLGVGGLLLVRRSRGRAHAAAGGGVSGGDAGGDSIGLGGALAAVGA